MPAEMSATELGEWAEYFGRTVGSMLLDAEFATLKSLISDWLQARITMQKCSAWITDPESLHEKRDDELMILGEGILPEVRYGPDSEPGSLI